MKARLGALLIVVGALGALLVPSRVLTPPSYSQGVDVFLNWIHGGSQKIGIVIPEFARLSPGADEGNFGRVLPEIIGNDLRFSALFAVVANESPFPADGEGLRKRLADLQVRGAQAAMQGFVSVTGQRLTVEFRLYDLITPDFRQIASKRFWADQLRDHRRLAHRIADEVVYQLTGERGIAETQIAFVTRSGPNKEIAMMDYDGFNQVALTDLKSISMSPVWSPTDSTIAFTSFFPVYTTMCNRSCRNAGV